MYTLCTCIHYMYLHKNVHMIPPYAYVYMHIHMHILYMCIFPLCLYVHTYTYVCTCIHICVSPHVHKYIVHTCVYMYISNLSHVHIPTYVISYLQPSSHIPIGGVHREPNSNTGALLQAADHRQLRSGKVSLSHQTDREHVHTVLFADNR